MSEHIPRSHMRAVDRLYWDPAERADGIMAIFNNVRAQLRKENVKNKRPIEEEVPSDWDLLCFAVEYLGKQSIVIGNEDLMSLAIPISQWLYSVHYSNPSRIYGAPDKPRDVGKAQEKEKRHRDETVHTEGPVKEAQVPSSDGRGSDGGGPGDHESEREAQGPRRGDRDGNDDGSGDDPAATRGE